MTVRNAAAVKNAMLDAYETNIGTAPLLKIYTGSPHASLGTAPSGTLLCTITLPSDWMSAASASSKAKTGTWSNTAAAAGTAGCYTLETSGGTIIEDGTVTATGGGGDMTVDNTSIAIGQTVTVNTFTKTL
jgi:hypothetical protein